MGWTVWRDDDLIHQSLLELRSLQISSAREILNCPEGKTQHEDVSQSSATPANIETAPATELELAVVNVGLDEASSKSSEVNLFEAVNGRLRSIVYNVLMDEMSAPERNEIVNRLLENPVVMCRLLQHDSG
jgi:hypothetical protein